MRTFAIRDELDDSKKDLAYLLYYENDKKFYIELPEEADPWETPLLLASLLKKGYKTIDSYWSLMWVKQRIVPTDRQNLGQVLKENGLSEYDEFQLLLAGEGRCAQDSYYIEEINNEEIVIKFAYRYEKRVEEIVPLNNGCLLTFFKNGKVKKIDIKKIDNMDVQLKRLLKFEELFRKVTIQPGGYGICWDENVMINNSELYDWGEEIPLLMEDFLSFVSERIVGTAEAMELLSCSRQNINDLIKRRKLMPVKKEQKNTLFLKSEIIKRNWQ